MKKVLIIILITILALPMLFANSVADATLTLQTKVRDIVMHGFETELPEWDFESLEPIDIFKYLLEEHLDSGDYEDNYNPISHAQDNQIGYDEVGDFDFGDPSYAIGYYVFLGNSPTSFIVSFKVSPFTHDGEGSDVVPWRFGYTQSGALNMSTSGTSVASGGGSYSPVILSDTSNSMKWAILKLSANFDFEEEVYVSSGTYTATVVAHITAN